MSEDEKYDLEDRTANFSLRTRDLCRQLKQDIINKEYISQLIRSAGSVAANYIEANESIGDKNFKMKIKICRRESKESSYWLRLVITDGSRKWRMKEVI